MKIIFYPNIDKSELDNGVVSEIGWQRLHPFLEKAFNLSKSERLVGITVSESGIKATFKTENPELTKQ